MESNTRNLVPIGRFSEVCRLTVKALRHYDELGLLKPVEVGPDSGYRYYSLAQVDDASMIRLLRALAMPLDEIRAVLREPDPAMVQRLLGEHRRRIEARIGEYQAALVALQRLMDSQEHAVQYDIKVKDVPAQPIVGIQARATQPELGQVLPPIFGEVFAYLGRAAVPPAGAPVVQYHDMQAAEEAGGPDTLVFEVGVPVPKPLAGEGSVQASEIKGGMVAYTLHVGPYDAISGAYKALEAWMQAHGHQATGAPREVHLTDPSQVQDPAAYHTEVAWPIR